MRIASDEEMKKCFIETYVDCQNEIPEGEKARFAEYVNEGCENGWEVALHAKAYGCYGGNAIFECDWNESLKCLLKLVDLTGNPDYYNTIGYIYYYGRCNGGNPEYEKAFKYFAVGAAHGLYESMYKIADMFISGNGCLKNPVAGAKMILSMYSDNLDIFCEGGFDGKFADVALRIGGLFERGIGVEQSFEDAFCFYREAKLAIDIRLRKYDFYGDKKVKKSIDEAIERVLVNIPIDYFTDEIRMEAPKPMGMLLSKSAGIDLTLLKDNDGYRLCAKGVESENAGARVIYNVPELNYCKLINETELLLDLQTEVLTDISKLPYTAFITGIIFDEEENVWKFMCGERAMLIIKTNGFIFRV